MNVRLLDLEPEWLYSDGNPKRYWRVASLAEANGIFFVCPLCYVNNENRRPGVHGVVCWNCTVPQTVTPNPARRRVRMRV